MCHYSLFFAGCHRLRLLQQIQKRAAFYIAFEQQEFFQKLRNQEVSPETVLKFRKYESEEGEAQEDMTFTRYLLAYYASDLTEKNELKDVYKRLLHFHKEEIEKQEAYLDSIWSDIVYFPVPDTIWDEEKKVTLETPGCRAALMVETEDMKAVILWQISMSGEITR